MQLIDEWRAVLARAWSVRLGVLTSVLAVLDAVTPALGGLVSPGTLAALTAVSAAGTVLSRIVAQPAASLPKMPE